MSMDKCVLLIKSLIETVGGKFIGRIKLQKTMYILQMAGLDCNLFYQYYHYGPYCEELADAAEYGVATKSFKEEQEKTRNGVAYSVYVVTQESGVKSNRLGAFTELAKKAANASSVELELAATALFLAKEENFTDAWGEVALRKPTKARDGRLEKAQLLYSELRAISPTLPEI